MANELFLSSISIAELMIKHMIGKFNVNFDPIEMANKIGLELLNFSGEEAVAIIELLFHHRDPFDRILIVQSLTNKLFLMTDDTKSLLYGCDYFVVLNTFNPIFK